MNKPITTITSGRLEGTRTAEGILQFKGIPYAAPPVGDLRWRAPQPPTPWSDLYDATHHRAICPQRQVPRDQGFFSRFYETKHPMSEDCLYLSVTTPTLDAQARLPVLLYLHGGSYETGCGHLDGIDGTTYAKQGIVFVAINYRLHVFGFLAHPQLQAEDPSGATGTYGTQDQLFALDWVRQNITAFGGDPDAITVYGQSAGAWGVQSLLASPASKGKIAKAIMSSGGGMQRGGTFEPQPLATALTHGQDFLALCGAAHISDLRARSAEDLLEAYLTFSKTRLLPFHPTVDGVVLPDTVFNYFYAARHDNIPTLVGATEDEMRKPEHTKPDPERHARFARKRFGDKADEYLEYTANKDDPLEYNDPVGNEMRAGANAWCESQDRLGYIPPYLYRFGHIPPHENGAYHCSDLPYFFNSLAHFGFDTDAEEQAFSDMLVEAMAAFVKTGRPTHARLTPWPCYTIETPYGMHLNTRSYVTMLCGAKITRYITHYNRGDM